MKYFLYTLFLMVFLLAFFTCMDATAEVVLFQHFTGYTKTTIEITFDEPTTSTVALHKAGTPGVIIATKDFDEATTITQTIPNLAYGTKYGIHVKDKDGLYTSGDTGFYLQTLHQFHFLKMLLDNASPDMKNVFGLVNTALDHTVPTDKALVLTEMERLLRNDFLSARALLRNVQEKQDSFLELRNVQEKQDSFLE